MRCCLEAIVIADLRLFRKRLQGCRSLSLVVLGKSRLSCKILSGLIVAEQIRKEVQKRLHRLQQAHSIENLRNLKPFHRLEVMKSFFFDYTLPLERRQLVGFWLIQPN